jgi:hypothetical protein
MDFIVIEDTEEIGFPIKKAGRIYIMYFLPTLLIEGRLLLP